MNWADYYPPMNLVSSAQNQAARRGSATPIKSPLLPLEAKLKRFRYFTAFSRTTSAGELHAHLLWNFEDSLRQRAIALSYSPFHHRHTGQFQPQVPRHNVRGTRDRCVLRSVANAAFSHNKIPVEVSVHYKTTVGEEIKVWRQRSYNTQCPAHPASRGKDTFPAQHIL